MSQPDHDTESPEIVDDGLTSPVDPQSDIPESWMAPAAGDESVPEPPTPAPRGRSIPGSASTGSTVPWTRSLTSTESVPGPAGLFYADVPNRLIAYAVDLIVLGVIGIILGLTVGQLFGGVTADPRAGGSLTSAGGELNFLALLVVGAIDLLISFAYFGYLWSAVRGTPGMKMLGLQIGDQSDGHSIDLRQASLRWLIAGLPATIVTWVLFVPDTLAFVAAVLGVGWLIILLYTIAQSPTKQGLHDRFARTIMVKAGRHVA